MLRQIIERNLLGDMLKSLHIILAYVTVAGFILRAFWSLSGAEDQLRQKWVRIMPHVIDTLLLALGITMVVQLAINPMESWLVAKVVGLLAYIGFGVVTLRANSMAVKLAALAIALLSAGYIFAVAFTRQAMPFSV